MGFFSSTKTYVYSTAVNLIDSPPDYTMAAIQTAIIDNRDIVDTLIAAYVDSISINMKKAYRYGYNHYYHGLPEGTSYEVIPKIDEIEDVVELETGKDVFINSIILDVLDVGYLAYDKLITENGWDPETNKVITYPFTPPSNWQPSYGVKVVGIHPDDKDNTKIYIRYEYVVVDGSTGSNKNEYYIETMIVDPYYLDEQYYHVTYYELDINQEKIDPIRYWYYRVASNIYPELNPDSGTDKGSLFYPIVPVRWDNQDMTREEVRDTELFKTSQKLIEITGMDIDNLAEGINENPDIDEIDHAFVFWGIDIQNQDPVAKEYLYKFFKFLQVVQKQDKNKYITFKGGTKESSPPSNTLIIKDAGLSIELRNNYIEGIPVTGSIGKVGTVETETVIKPKYQYQVKHGDNTLPPSQRYETTVYVEESEFIIKKQLNEKLYEELIVSGLQHLNHVTSKKYVLTDLVDTLDDENENFLIPIAHNVLKEFSIKDEIEIYFQSYRMIFQSIIKVKTKWYESNFFKIVITVVAVVSLILGMPQLSKGVMALYATYGFVVTAAIIISSAIAIQLTLKELMGLIAKEFGIKVAMVVYMVALVISFGYNYSNGGMPPANDALTLTNAVQNNSASWQQAAQFESIAAGGGYESLTLGQAVLRAGAGSLFGGVQSGWNEVIGHEYKELQRNQEEFAKLQEEKNELLETAMNDLYGTQSNLNPLLFTDSLTASKETETPEQFITRTKYSNNIGVELVNIPHNHVDIFLNTPPQIKEPEELPDRWVGSLDEILV